MRSHIISFNHSIIVTAEFNSIGLKTYLISSPKRFSRFYSTWKKLLS
jgi:hypothetical protein